MSKGIDGAFENETLPSEVGRLPIQSCRLKPDGPFIHAIADGYVANLPFAKSNIARNSSMTHLLVVESMKQARYRMRLKQKGTFALECIQMNVQENLTQRTVYINPRAGGTHSSTDALGMFFPYAPTIYFPHPDFGVLPDAS